MKRNCHFGCESAASATAKVVRTSTYDYKKGAAYFGNLEDAIRNYAISLGVDKGAAFPLYSFELYAKDLNTKKWVEIDVDDEVLDSIWATSSLNPANKSK